MNPMGMQALWAGNEPVRPQSIVTGIFIALTVLAATLYFWGIRQDLPYNHNGDEEFFVKPAVAIAASGNWNPGWFGNPGSTMIYPLAITYRVGFALAPGGRMFGANPKLQQRFEIHPTKFYLAGRVLAAVYAALGVGLIFLVGLRGFGLGAGLLGSLFFLTYELVVSHAQVVRTDSAGVFFSLLALWFCLRADGSRRVWDYLGAGAAIGLSLSTRYFLVALIPVLVLVAGKQLWQERQRRDWTGFDAACRNTVLGFLVVALSFFLTSPYLFLDLSTAMNNILLEARATHLGHDGFSPWGNAWWYLARVLPQTMTWPQTLAAGLGLAFLIIRREQRPWPLLLFGVVFMLGICLSPLHWERWIIQLLPLMALLAAYGLMQTIPWGIQRLRVPALGMTALVGCLGLLLIAQPAARVIKFLQLQSQYSTEVVAQQWVEEHIPAGSAIAQEWYTGNLNSKRYRILRSNPLPTAGTLDAYCQQGCRYVMASSYMYDRFLKDPQRYAKEVEFYNRLFSQTKLLQEIKPEGRRGPTIRIYELK